VPSVIIRLEGKEMKTLKLSEETAGSEKEMGVRPSTTFLTLPFQMKLIITPIKSNYYDPSSLVELNSKHLTSLIGLSTAIAFISISVWRTITYSFLMP
jgi:hypothetical protein